MDNISQKGLLVVMGKFEGGRNALGHFFFLLLCIYVYIYACVGRCVPMCVQEGVRVCI